MNGTTAGVSVIVPVYNGERYLAQAIESILAQTLPPIEIIVIDDGSSDNSSGIAQEFGQPVRCLRQKNQGISAARNRGIELSSGQYLAFLDADDLWLPDKLRLQLAPLRSDPALDASFTHIRQFYSPDISAETKKNAAYSQEVMAGYVATTFLIRRASFLRFGSFDILRRAGEFIDWFGRARDGGLRFRLLDDTLALRRIHDCNTGIRLRQENRSEYLRMIKTTLDRRRGEKPS
jgi:glycosyltransferase involved in cell wall biosynthesis